MAALAFAALVLITYAAQVAVGFGGTLLAISIGGALVGDIPHLVTVLVPASLVVTGTIVSVQARHVRWVVLLTSIAPLMALGVLAAELLQPLLADASFVEPAYALFVCGIAIAELRKRNASAIAPGRPHRGVLFAAGIVHGIYASGGPLVVTALSGARMSKHEFRATLSALWLVMNASMSVLWMTQGRIRAETALESLTLVPALLGALVLGGLLHRRVDEDRFRTLVAWGLLASGLALLWH